MLRKGEFNEYRFVAVCCWLGLSGLTSCDNDLAVVCSRHSILNVLEKSDRVEHDIIQRQSLVPLHEILNVRGKTGAEEAVFQRHSEAAEFFRPRGDYKLFLLMIVNWLASDMLVRAEVETKTLGLLKNLLTRQKIVAVSAP